MVKKYVLLFIIAIIFINCDTDEPNIHGRSLEMKLFFEYEEKLLDTGTVTLRSHLYNETITKQINSDGYVFLKNLLFTEYLAKISSRIILDNNNRDTVSVARSLSIIPNDHYYYEDTIEMEIPEAQKGLKINEIYYCGSAEENNYHYDQYIELYNSSKETIYLDGMIICRLNKALDDVLSIFRFPGKPMGETQNYPINPEEFKVVAQDARDHSLDYLGGENSVNLENADFEFKNKLQFGDYDNPDAPNLDNLETGYTSDFFIHLKRDLVVITNGTDSVYTDGIDQETILDGVIYYNNEASFKIPGIDDGYAGYGIVKYSGFSIERILPGYDTNNSTLDFENQKIPTPGYQHE